MDANTPTGRQQRSAHVLCYDYVPSWENLRVLGNSKAVRSSYIWLIVVPLAAKLFAKFPAVIPLPFFSRDLHLDIQLPFSWQAFFFAAACFSIANAVYSWRCPALIKQYATFTDYRADGASSYMLLLYAFDYVNDQFSNDANCRIRQLREIAQRFCDCTAASPEETLRTDNDIFQFDINDSRIADAFAYVRNCLSHARRGSRLLATSFYGVGFLLLAVVFANLVVSVLYVSDLREFLGF